MRRAMFSLAAIVAAAVLLPGVAGEAAASKSEGAHPASEITLKKYRGEIEIGPVEGQVELECEPAGGTHPEYGQACERLAEVDGDFSRLPDAQMMCTMEYAPVTVVARGKWQGDRVHFRETYSNSCQASAKSNEVFDF
ncbi:MAG: hypothetical protein GEU98_18280 [Pseudonocardiaceae bacterium]|nr:hypothetical protein [Pseudonocardiaceae bacterium]